MKLQQLQNIYRQQKQLMIRRLLLTFFAILTIAAVQAQVKVSVEDYDLITEQPDGELRVYQRAGQVRLFDEDTHQLTSREQSGTLSVVFAADGAVYLQNPVSGLTGYMSRGCWAKGTLSEDGHTITMPLGQYIDYTRSFDIVSVMYLYVYDNTEQTYVIDESVTQVTYTLHDDGTITLNGTDQNHILSAVYRSFNGHEIGTQVDGLWCEMGDYESVYTLFADQPVSLPAGLDTEEYMLIATANDGIDWLDYSVTVQMAFSGDDVYVQGLCKFLPRAWVKGQLKNNTLTIPQGQYLGTYQNLPLYFVGARDGQSGIVMTDVVFTFDGQNTYTTTDYVIINGKKDALYIYLYYYGATITQQANELVQAPEGLQTNAYTLTYHTYDANNQWVSDKRFVNIGFVGNEVYMQRIWEVLPNAWVKGRVENGKVLFDGPQFLGTYEDYNEKMPAYFIPFSPTTGELLSTISFDYDSEVGTLAATQQAVGICLNRARLLTLVDLWGPELTLIPDVAAEPGQPAILNYFGEEETLPRIELQIPDTSVEGAPLDPNKLSYQLLADVEHEIQPIVLTDEYYERIPEEMTAIPWLYVDNYDVTMPGDDHVRMVYLNAPVTDYNRIGVQSVYTGGGQVMRSAIVWHDIKDFVTGVASVQLVHDSANTCYDLQGRKVVKPAGSRLQKGIYIVNGRKVKF